MTTKSKTPIKLQPVQSGSGCETCPMHNAGNLLRLGVDMTDWDYVVALAGNPNTGKSTVFNALTGLRQHTGNWPSGPSRIGPGGLRPNTALLSESRAVRTLELPMVSDRLIQKKH